jgi:CheY-like chemotaxis protein
MPEMDGFELLKFIKSVELLKEIPVIMMSADDENHLVAACI